MREYEHDYECNKRLVDCREDKIARLEQLADGVLADADFLAQEREAAQLERRAMQEKIDRHPEVTRFAMENMRLVEQLRRWGVSGFGVSMCSDWLLAVIPQV